MTTLTRTLTWPACYNVRDLGGLPTRDGYTTAWCAIVRSDIPARLTRGGQTALLDYGIRTIIDLREPDQVNAEPSIFMAQGDNPALPLYRNLPMETREPAVSALIGAAKDRAAVYQIVLEHYPGLIAKIIRAIATAREGGILIHCHAGKDRTGIVVALLLGLVGVPHDVIAADYAESQVCLWPLWEEIVAKVGSEDKADFWLKPTATAAMMDSLLVHLDHRYGGVAAYLRAIGLTEAELCQVRGRLLEPTPAALPIARTRSDHIQSRLRHLTLVVNAGGQSRRMGHPKALLPLPPSHQPLLHVIVQRLQALSPQQTVIIANDPTLRDQLALGDAITWLTDAYPDTGPLGGLATALAICPDWAICVACDLPLLNPALFAYFCTLTAEVDEIGAARWDAIVPVVDHYPEALHSLYQRRCLPAIAARLAAGERRATCFLPDVRVRYVNEEELRQLDRDLHSFLNANTPAEWAQALTLLTT